MKDGNKMPCFIRIKTAVRKSMQIIAVFHLTKVKVCPGFKFVVLFSPLPAKGVMPLAVAASFGCQSSWAVCGL